MIVRNILQEELLTLAEVKAVLDDIRARRSGETEELGYELRRAMRHTELFAKGTPEDSRRMLEELLKRDKITPEIAIKIVDIRPQNRDELRAVYAKERFSLSEEELDAILDIAIKG